jgi:hypothetical protein
MYYELYLLYLLKQVNKKIPHMWDFFYDKLVVLKW